MQLLNTLYITTQHAYLHLDHDTVRVEVARETTLRVPVIHLESIVCFGNVLLSPALIHRFAEDGRALVWLDRTGRFRARTTGPTGGNVLLRRAQHLCLSDDLRTREVARSVVAAKVQNSRQVLLRAAREARDQDDTAALRDGADQLTEDLARVRIAESLDEIRGCEGDAARAYFRLFGRMVRFDRETFRFLNRTRRPPLDPLNALLSFAYALLLNDCVSALEAVGLDPQIGYLHALRPGRPALALDLMEELRAVVADRLALTLVNRRQLTRRSFEETPGNSVQLTEAARRALVTAYQRRKQENLPHAVLDRSVPLGLVPLIQARLLARHLREDLEYYPPFLSR